MNGKQPKKRKRDDNLVCSEGRVISETKRQHKPRYILQPQLTKKEEQSTKGKNIHRKVFGLLLVRRLKITLCSLWFIGIK